MQSTDAPMPSGITVRRGQAGPPGGVERRVRCEPAPSPQEVAPAEAEREQKGLTIPRHFTRAGSEPAAELLWEERTARITAEDGRVVFEQQGVRVPKGWSQLATNVVASRYFRTLTGSGEREHDVGQMVARVVDYLTARGREGGYFAAEADAAAFSAELSHLLLHQQASFNSPVWFNVGVEQKPQASACFINSVEDSLSSILSLARTEGMLFKYGSGTGTNLSALRGSQEQLKGGGTASGPVSFMRGFDAFAGVIKSGGQARRAAKMVILNDSHPDLLEFIRCKALEEQKAQALIQAGYDGSFGGEAYRSVFFQNANHAVRLSDAFLQAVMQGGEWTTRAVVDGRPMQSYPARALFHELALAAWRCGDPGLQFHDTINRWHTCREAGPINASNPCSEYMFLDDSACNLASLNLLSFRTGEGRFDVHGFKAAVEILILAMEILVGASSYPTEQIARNSQAYRPLGLGYANLGALLLSLGLPYDSEAGRAYAASITALLTGSAYAMSARIAAVLGPFSGFAANREPMLSVIGRHRQAAAGLRCPERKLRTAAQAAWRQAQVLGERHGYRNAQVTVLAPTGTIGFMMDCDTTGIEPDLALIKYKQLEGGGSLKLCNRTVPLALSRLGYPEPERERILAHLEQQETIEGAPGLKEEHLPVFDCAFPQGQGSRAISPSGHLQMMAAVQPFLSGAISKTVNLPHSATVEEVEQTYLSAWRLGLKAVALYRDGCKGSQPLSTRKEPRPEVESVPPAPAVPEAVRRRLPPEREALTHQFSLGGHQGILTAGLYPDGSLGEVFVTLAKEGSTLAGLMDAFAAAVSLALQYGVPLPVLCDRFSHTRFEPQGFTGNPDLPLASSLPDYLFRYLAHRFPGPQARPPAAAGEGPGKAPPRAPEQTRQVLREGAFPPQADAPPCASCGALMLRAGACYRCGNCGASSGCS